jgi:hypothetical protein
MINLDDRFHSYLAGTKQFCIDGTCEKVRTYGFHSSDDQTVDGFYVVTDNHKLVYNLQEQCISCEAL